MKDMGGRDVDFGHNYSFGERFESANLRKKILHSLIPRLKIAKQYSFEDHFLVEIGIIEASFCNLSSKTGTTILNTVQSKVLVSDR